MLNLYSNKFLFNHTNAFWHLFLDSSLRDTSEEPIKSKKCRPTNLDEVELDQNPLIKNADTNKESSNTANLALAEELNISLGEEPIKVTSNDSVSPYSIVNQTKTITHSPVTSPGPSSFTGSSIFTFTKPVDTTSYWHPSNNSSSTPDGGVVIKPNSLYLERRGSPAWPYSMSQSPPVSASLIAEDTSSSSHPHHIHHLHHRPLHLHHYSSSPSQQPITKDITVELSDHNNSSNTGINNVITNTSPGVNNRNDVTSYISPSYSNLLQSASRSNQMRDDQIQSGPINMIGVSSDYMCSSIGSQEEKETNSNSSIKYIRDNP